jgi:hypothetical protein
LALSGVLAIAAAALAVRGQNSPDLTMLPIDHPAIQYVQGPLDDPVARLDKQLASGKIKLEFRSDRLGYLPSLLRNLGVNPDSQVLVFSKTSFQAAKIAPREPRALFFSDDVMVMKLGCTIRLKEYPRSPRPFLNADRAITRADLCAILTSKSACFAIR